MGAIPYAPWDWNIYLHEWLKFMVNISKYPMLEHFGAFFGGIKLDAKIPRDFSLIMIVHCLGW